MYFCIKHLATHGLQWCIKKWPKLYQARNHCEYIWRRRLKYLSSSCCGDDNDRSRSRKVRGRKLPAHLVVKRSFCPPALWATVSSLIEDKAHRSRASTVCTKPAFRHTVWGFVYPRLCSSCFFFSPLLVLMKYSYCFLFSLLSNTFLSRCMKSFWAILSSFQYCWKDGLK